MLVKAMCTKEGKEKEILAAVGLIITTIIWGSGFVVMKNTVDVIAPTYVLAFRFTIAAIAMILVFWKRVRGITKSDLLRGSLLGVFLFISYFLQTYGLLYTTASKNAFITTLYVVFVPFLHWRFNHVKPKRSNVAAAFVAAAGLGLLSLEKDLCINIGDLLTLACGFFFAVHIVFIDRYGADHDPIKMTVLQMAVAAALNWLAAFVLEGPFCGKAIDNSTMAALLYLGIFSTMVGFILQNVGQKHLTPNTSSILLSFESVFGLMFSVVFLGDPLTVKLIAGCVLMLAAVILSEYKRKEPCG